MSRILMVSSEATPYAKTGGLADVVGSLPGALQQLGHEVAVLIPRYKHYEGSWRIQDGFNVWMGGNQFWPSIYEASGQKNGPTNSATAPVRFFFLDFPSLFDRNGIYGDKFGEFGDNDLRFALLCRGAIEVARSVFRTDIFHCHDWQAGLVPAYLKTVFANDPTFFGAKTIFSIHNLGYQGIFPASTVPRVGLPTWTYRPDLLEFHGTASFLKAGLVYADALTTVSPTYAREIQTPAFGFGMDGMLRARRHQLTGILNGCDYDTWNPETDPHIAEPYSAVDLSGKAVCKAELLKEFGLPERAVDRPLLGIVSRFTAQKGADLIANIAGALFNEDVYLVALGSGEPEYEAMFRSIAGLNPGRAAIYFGYNDAMAHRIEAGSDIFLMPSRYEPCGLNQMYSLRYGTVPVVRATGGLEDSVDGDTGFKFWDYDGWQMLAALRIAFAEYQDKAAWEKRIRTGMSRGFSWTVSARHYSDLYENLLGG